VNFVLLRIAIIDDTEAVCNQMERYLTEISDKYCIETEIEPYNSGESFVAKLKNGDNYDLIFMDIEMHEMSGIDVGNYIRNTLDDELQPIIFISAKHEYSLELHRLHPLDFLIKEIRLEDVERVFKRYLKIAGMHSEFFEIKVRHDVQKIRIKDIKYLTVANRLVYIVMKDEQHIEYYGTLENAYKTQLKKFGFLFTHKQYVVNPDYAHIYEYDRIILTDGTVIPIGSSRRKEIRNQLTVNN